MRAPLPTRPRAGAPNPAPAAPQRVGSLSCPHCGHEVTGLNATLDERALRLLGQQRAAG